MKIKHHLLRAALAALATLLLNPDPAFAVAYTWNGGGGDDLWNNASNWGGTAPVGSTTNTLTFDGSTRLTPSNNLTAGTTFSTITFAATSGAFVLSGNSVNIYTTAGIINSNTTLVETINMNLTTSQTSFKFLSSVGSRTLVNGIISGAWASGLQQSGGTLILAGANTYSTSTNILAGAISVANIGSVGGGASNLGNSTTVANGTVNIGNTSATGLTLIYTGTGETTDRVINLAGTTGGATLDQSGASGLLKFTTALTAVGLGNKTLTLQGSTAGTGEIAAAIVNSTGFATALTKAGSGTWTLSGTNTYTGNTTVNGGTLEIKSGASPLTQTLGVLAFAGADGTLISNKSGAGTLSTTFTTLAARAAGNTGNILSIGGTNGTDNSIILTQAAGFIDKGVYFNGADFASMNATNTYVRALAYGTDPNAAAVNTITASNHVKLTSTPGSQNTTTLLSLNLSGSGVSWTNNASQTLTAPGIIKSGNGTQSTISGGSLTGGTNTELVIRTDTVSDLLAISSNLTQGSGVLTKSGAGTLTLSGTNTFTGQTYVNGGTLSIGANVNLGAQATGATLNLRGGTLQATNTFGLYNGSAGTNNRAVVLTNAAGFGVTGGNTLTVAGVVSGSGSLTKSGTGTQILSGANTYTGATTVSVGTLLINGNSIAATGAIAVTNGAILGGAGTVGAAITSAGTLSPGDGTTAIGTFNATALTLNTGANFQFDLGGSSASDRIALTGAFTRGTGTSFSVNFNNTGVANSTYTLATFASLAGGFTAGNVSNFTYTGLAGGVTGGTFGLTGTDLTFTTVPEPATWALLAFSLTTVLVLRRRRNF